jgi:hypothetical protein
MSGLKTRLLDSVTEMTDTTGITKFFWSSSTTEKEGDEKKPVLKKSSPKKEGKKDDKKPTPTKEVKKDDKKPSPKKVDKPKVIPPKISQQELLAGKIGLCTLSSPITGFKKIIGEYDDEKLTYCIAQVTVTKGTNVLRPHRTEKIAPKRTRVYKENSDKLRASAYLITEIIPMNQENKKPLRFFSMWNNAYEYKEVQGYKPDKFDINHKKEESNGLYFFLTREEAERFRPF